MAEMTESACLPYAAWIDALAKRPTIEESLLVKIRVDFRALKDRELIRSVISLLENQSHATLPLHLFLTIRCGRLCLLDGRLLHGGTGNKSLESSW